MGMTSPGSDGRGDSGGAQRPNLRTILKKLYSFLINYWLWRATSSLMASAVRKMCNYAKGKGHKWHGLPFSGRSLIYPAPSSLPSWYIPNNFYVVLYIQISKVWRDCRDDDLQWEMQAGLWKYAYKISGVVYISWLEAALDSRLCTFELTMNSSTGMGNLNFFLKGGSISSLTITSASMQMHDVIKVAQLTLPSLVNKQP